MSENTIDFRRILGQLANLEYTGAFAVEYVWIEWKNCNQVDNVSETILLRDLLREIASETEWKA